VRGSKGLDHSTFGAAGDESEGDDLYIVIRDVMIHDNLGGTADYFAPYALMHMGLFLHLNKTVLFAAQGSLPYIKEDY